MNKFFRNKKRYIFPLMLSAMAIAASSCGSDPSVDSVGQTPSDETPVASSPFPSDSSETRVPKTEITQSPSPTAKTAPFGTETVPTSEIPNQNKTGNLKNSDITLFTSDLECQNLVPSKSNSIS